MPYRLLDISTALNVFFNKQLIDHESKMSGGSKKTKVRSPHVYRDMQTLIPFKQKHCITKFFLNEMLSFKDTSLIATHFLV